jgi:glycosyltransferase involved in cell wall biosynthesis
MSDSNESSILILMGTYNGEKYIREQLDSIAAQTHKNWRLVISDDGSTDQTIEIARQWAKEVGEGRVEFRKGPRQGFSKNFLSMACDPNLRADFYAFSDQDDIWRENKLRAALNWLTERGQDTPSLYCARTELISQDGIKCGFSPLIKKSLSFRNALVQNVAGGNTIAFNQSLKNYLERVGVVPAVAHDWWLYQTVTAFAGNIFYDPNPQLLYRQHSAALIGAKNTLSKKLRSLKMALMGRFKEHTDQNIVCLLRAYEQFHPENKRLFDSFCYLRTLTLIKRLLEFRRAGFYRQTIAGNLILIILIAAGKL